MAEVKRDKWISIMIIPEDGAGVKKWRLTTRRFARLKILLGVSVVLLAVGLISLLSIGVMYVKMKQYQRSNIRLLSAADKLGAMASRLEQFEERERTLRELLGSDIQLPEAPADSGSVIVNASGGMPTSTGGNEIEQAISRRETLLRRKPDIWPVARAWQVSDWYREGKDAAGEHFGIDIIASRGANVVASAEGRVVFAGTDENLGLMVAIDHENGWETRYGHNHLLLVKYGDTVRKGQPIAIYGGLDGKGTGKHLHYEMLYRDKAVNPLQQLPRLSLTKNAVK